MLIPQSSGHPVPSHFRSIMSTLFLSSPPDLTALDRRHPPHPEQPQAGDISLSQTGQLPRLCTQHILHPQLHLPVPSWVRKHQDPEVIWGTKDGKISCHLPPNLILSLSSLKYPTPCIPPDPEDSLFLTPTCHPRTGPHVPVAQFQRHPPSLARQQKGTEKKVCLLAEESNHKIGRNTFLSETRGFPLEIPAKEQRQDRKATVQFPPRHPGNMRHGGTEDSEPLTSQPQASSPPGVGRTVPFPFQISTCLQTLLRL